MTPNLTSILGIVQDSLDMRHAHALRHSMLEAGLWPHQAIPHPCPDEPPGRFWFRGQEVADAQAAWILLQPEDLPLLAASDACYTATLDPGREDLPVILKAAAILWLEQQGATST